MKNVRNTMFLSVVILTAAAAFFAIGLFAGGYFGHRLATVAIEAEEIDLAEGEYYRGVYDICIQQIRKVKTCQKIVKSVTEAHWYDKPSTGWEWPQTRGNSVAQSQ